VAHINGQTGGIRGATLTGRTAERLACLACARPIRRYSTGSVRICRPCSERFIVTYTARLATDGITPRDERWGRAWRTVTTSLMRDVLTA